LGTTLELALSLAPKDWTLETSQSRALGISHLIFTQFSHK
jgi:hypothetical protein